MGKGLGRRAALRFVIIRAAQQVFEPMITEDIRAVERAAGLDPGAVDHGIVMPGIGIVVAEFGFFEPPDKQHYFALAGKLFAGSAVLYGFDERGESIDLAHDPMPTWFGTAEDVEAAIAAGQLQRPVMRVCGRVVWQWPGPRPDQDMITTMLRGLQ